MYNMDVLGIKNVDFRRKYGDYFENMDKFSNTPVIRVPFTNICDIMLAIWIS